MDETVDPSTGERLASMETKIDFLIDNAKTERVENQKKIEDHDKRLKVVERICYGFVAIGGISIFGAGGAAASTLVK